jgi:hypothetical protein
MPCTAAGRGTRGGDRKWEQVAGGSVKTYCQSKAFVTKQYCLQSYLNNDRANRLSKKNILE